MVSWLEVKASTPPPLAVLENIFTGLFNFKLGFFAGGIADTRISASAIVFALNFTEIWAVIFLLSPCLHWCVELSFSLDNFAHLGDLSRCLPGFFFTPYMVDPKLACSFAPIPGLSNACFGLPFSSISIVWDFKAADRFLLSAHVVQILH